MTRGLFAVALLVWSSFGLVSCDSPKAPGVLLITIDTLRADHLGAYGSPDIRTPNIDRLAGSGTLFENAAAPMPLTRPSHFSIFTSLYPREHGVVNNAIALPDSLETLTEILRERGYRTGAFVAVSLLDAESGAAQGFDVFEAPTGARHADASQVVEKTVAWLSGIRSEQTFFAWVHLFDPHLPYSPPEDFRPEPREGLAEVSAKSLEEIATHNDGDIPRPVFERAKSLYAGEVEYVDHWVGRLLDALAATGRQDTTLTLLTADHGESFERGVYFEHADSLFQETIQIPLIVRHPKSFAAGERITRQVSSIDVAPTVLRALELPLPEHFVGMPLQQVDSAGERYVLIQHPFYQPRALQRRPKRQEIIRSVSGMPTAKILVDSERIGIVGESWKYVASDDREEFYRMTATKNEDENLAGTGAAPEAELRRRLEAERSAHPLRLADPGEINAELLETLKALGYVY